MEEKKRVALTFDDGPNTTTTLEVLEVLKKYHIIASFFVIGDNINDQTEQVIKQAYDMGCEINNHAKTHSDMTKLDRMAIQEEITYTSNRVYRITGEHTKFFRPPYISVNNRMYEEIHMPFICGYGCEDYNENISMEERVNRTLKQVKDGAIILLHDSKGNSKTVSALEEIIPALQQDGYEFVTVSILFETAGLERKSNAHTIYSCVR
ncbi:MAG: polysaccharide deacetylase family protein [bacterium]|nr:polysaccharide deacetylase family protein [bacterium]